MEVWIKVRSNMCALCFTTRILFLEKHTPPVKNNKELCLPLVKCENIKHINKTSKLKKIGIILGRIGDRKCDMMYFQIPAITFHEIWIGSSGFLHCLIMLIIMPIYKWRGFSTPSHCDPLPDKPILPLHMLFPVQSTVWLIFIKAIAY